jgi:hypothetical protein
VTDPTAKQSISWSLELSDSVSCLSTYDGIHTTFYVCRCHQGFKSVARRYACRAQHDWVLEFIHCLVEGIILLKPMLTFILWYNPSYFCRGVSLGCGLSRTASIPQKIWSAVSLTITPPWGSGGVGTGAIISGSSGTTPFLVQPFTLTYVNASYIYIPLGGAKNSVVSTALVFSFVALWHDLSFKLLIWGWLVVLFILPEMAARYLLPASVVRAQHFIGIWWEAASLLHEPNSIRAGFLTYGFTVWTTIVVPTCLCTRCRGEHFDDDDSKLSRFRCWRGRHVVLCQGTLVDLGR